VKKPDGRVYINDKECWLWLSETAADAARWLRYLPFDRIHDGRNEAPEFCNFSYDSDPTVSFNGDLFISRIEDPLIVHPSISISGGHVSQPYNIAFIGEKSSLKPILQPIARRVGGQLWLPTGDLSTTMLSELEYKAYKDGRPLIILYFSDFDPSGFNMPICVARKLQALIDLRGHQDLEVQVHAVALTYDQVCEFDLPSTPLKEDEKRAGAWKEAWNREQTEIDALATLQPEVLRQIANDAVKPFFDATLERRVESAINEWNETAQDALETNEEYQEALAKAEKQLERIKKTQEMLRQFYAMRSKRISQPEMPELELPEPEIDEEAPEPIFTTDDDWLTQTKKLIARRAYEEGVALAS